MKPINRRDVLKWMGAGAAAMALPGLGAAAPPTAPRPNVLFMIADDLNFWVNCIGGHTGVISPNMDRLAARGVLFANAQCPAPICNPARVALLTGLRPSTTGVYRTQPFRSVLPRAVTLPMHFMNSGYRVVGGGKIYHDTIPDPMSWQEYFPSQQHNVPSDPIPRREIAVCPGLKYGEVENPESEMGDYKVAQWAIGELNKKHDQPFFIGAGFRKPHIPLNVPQSYYAMNALDKIQLPLVQPNLDGIPPIGRNWALIEKGTDIHKVVLRKNAWKPLVQAYMACISFVDAQIGRVLSALEAGPYANNTIVVLCADHGWHLGPKLHWKKQCLWEEACHVPLMIVAPGLTKPGGRCTAAVSTLDIFPTLIELCGLTLRKDIEGTSIVPQLKDPQTPGGHPAITTFERENHAVRTEQWRFIRYNDGTEELYDKQKDKLEWTNLAGDARYADVKKELAQWLPKINAATAAGDKGDD